MRRPGRPMPGWLMGGGAALVLAGLAVLSGPGTAAGQAGASLVISPPSQNVTTGTSDITLEIKAQNVTNLGAYEVTLVFDANVLEYVSSSDYGWLTTTGRTQTCFGFGQSASAVNQYAALHVGCATNGLVENGQGDPGPNGTATVAQAVFRAKAPGQGTLVFKGLGTDKYYIGAPDPALPAGAIESGQTSLVSVEVCPGGGGDCLEQDIPFAPGAGVVGVTAPNAATPTALPPTPTPEAPSGVSDEDFQATVAAAVGTPRTLPTSVGQTADAVGGAGASGASGATGGGTSGAAGRPGTGAASIAGGELPEGVTIGPDGIPRGPDGAPIAGYGPQPADRNPAWMWGGLALLLWGALAIGCGALARLGGRGAS